MMSHLAKQQKCGSKDQKFYRCWSVKLPDTEFLTLKEMNVINILILKDMAPKLGYFTNFKKFFQNSSTGFGCMANINFNNVGRLYFSTLQNNT